MSNVRPLTLAEISASLPGARGAKRLSPSTLTRWILTGCPARDGRRVRLKATRCGSRWLVHQTHLDEFFSDLAAEPSPSPTIRSPAESRRANEAAAQRLDKKGA